MEPAGYALWCLVLFAAFAVATELGQRLGRASLQAATWGGATLLLGVLAMLVLGKVVSPWPLFVEVGLLAGLVATGYGQPSAPAHLALLGGGFGSVTAAVCIIASVGSDWWSQPVALLSLIGIGLITAFVPGRIAALRSAGQTSTAMASLNEVDLPVFASRSGDDPFHRGKETLFLKESRPAGGGKDAAEQTLRMECSACGFKARAAASRLGSLVCPKCKSKAIGPARGD